MSYNHMIILKKDVQNISVIFLEWVLTNSPKSIVSFFFSGYVAGLHFPDFLQLSVVPHGLSLRHEMPEEVLYIIPKPVPYNSFMSGLISFFPFTLAGLETPSHTYQDSFASLGLSNQTKINHRSYPMSSFTNNFQNTTNYKRQSKAGSRTTLGLTLAQIYHLKR